MKYEHIFARDGYTCCYCGYQGKDFINFMFLCTDHILPRQCGGDDSDENLVVACQWCNSIAQNMKFTPEESKEEIIQKKRNYIAKQRAEHFIVYQRQILPHIHPPKIESR